MSLWLRWAKNNRENMATLFFPLSQWVLSVAMETRVFIQSAPKPYAAFPHTSDATHKIWSRLANWPQRYSFNSVDEDRWTTDHWYTISSPCKPSAQVSNHIVQILGYKLQPPFQIYEFFLLFFFHHKWLAITCYFCCIVCIFKQLHMTTFTVFVSSLFFLLNQS